MGLVRLDTNAGGTGGVDNSGDSSDDDIDKGGCSGVFWNLTVLDRVRPDTRTGSGGDGGTRDGNDDDGSGRDGGRDGSGGEGGIEGRGGGGGSDGRGGGGGSTSDGAGSYVMVNPVRRRTRALNAPLNPPGRPTPAGAAHVEPSTPHRLCSKCRPSRP